MAFLPKHLHPDFAQPGVQPIGPIEIDYGHPSTDGLVLAVVGRKDFVSGEIAQPVGYGGWGPSNSAVQKMQNVGYSTPHRPGIGLRSNIGDGSGGFKMDAKYARSRLEGQPMFTAMTGFYTEGTANSCVFGFHQGGSYTPDLYMDTNTNRIRFLVDFVSGIATFVSLQPALNKFHIAGIIKNDTNTLRGFLDGSMQTSGTNSVFAGDITLGSDLGLLTSHPTAVVGSEGLLGGMNFIFMWNRELSDAEYEAVRLNPYQIFKPAIPLIVGPVLAAGVDDVFFANRLNAIHDQQVAITAHTLNGVLNT